MANDLNLAFKLSVKGGQELSGSLRLAKQQVADLVNAVSKSGNQSQKVFAKSRNELGLLSKQVSEAKSLLVGFFSIRAATSLAGDILDVNREFEKLRAQLKSITGSTAGAQAAFNFIQDFARDTPFQVQGLTEAFIQLRNYGIEPTAQVMDAVTNQASKLGGSQETLAGITRALGQAYTKGKLQAEEMLQLAERGVPVYDLLARATGRNTAELQEMSAKGLLTRDTIDKLIVKMGELAAGSNAAQMDTLNGKISNLSDAWNRFEDTLLNDQSEGLIKDIVQSVTNEIAVLTSYLDSSLEAQIQRTEARIRNFEAMGGLGRFVGDFTGFDINLEKNRLDILKKQKRVRDEQAAAIAKQREAQAQLNRENEEAGDQSDRQLRLSRQRAEAGAAAIANLKREIALQNDSSAQAAIDYDITKGALKDISNAQKERLLQLAAEKDAIRAAAEAYREYDAIVAEGVRLAQRQRAETEQTIMRLREQFNPALVELERGLSNVAQALDLGVIDEARAKSEYDKLGKAYNESFIEPAKRGADDLSVYTEQAARNIQDSLADFLFDPFDEGLDGMLTGFLTTIRRMTAEIAASKILDVLKPAAEAGISAAGDALGSVVGSLFADGGVMTDQGPLPLNRYASGGIANSPQLALFGEGRQNEAYVPLPDGRTIPVTLKLDGAAGGQRPIYVTNYFTVGKDMSRQSQTQIAAAAGRGIQKAMLRLS